MKKLLDILREFDTDPDETHPVSTYLRKIIGDRPINFCLSKEMNYNEFVDKINNSPSKHSKGLYLWYVKGLNKDNNYLQDAVEEIFGLESQFQSDVSCYVGEAKSGINQRYKSSGGHFKTPSRYRTFTPKSGRYGIGSTTGHKILKVILKYKPNYLVFGDKDFPKWLKETGRTLGGTTATDKVLHDFFTQEAPDLDYVDFYNKIMQWLDNMIAFRVILMPNATKPQILAVEKHLIAVFSYAARSHRGEIHNSDSAFCFNSSDSTIDKDNLPEIPD